MIKRFFGKYRAVFFDKDGVINEMVDRGREVDVWGVPMRLTAPWNLEELRLYPGVVPLLKAVQELGYLAIVITNQPDVAYGLMKKESLQSILFAVRGLGFDDLLHCPHRRDEGCDCKKPKPGMLYTAAEKWNIDLSNSFMLGDTVNDVGAARAVGCKAVIIDQHYNKQVESDIRINTHADLLAYL